jgi:hypothetical protein
MFAICEVLLLSIKKRVLYPRYAPYLGRLHRPLCDGHHISNVIVLNWPYPIAEMTLCGLGRSSPTFATGEVKPLFLVMFIAK